MTTIKRTLYRPQLEIQLNDGEWLVLESRYMMSYGCIETDKRLNKEQVFSNFNELWDYVVTHKIMNTGKNWLIGTRYVVSSSGNIKINENDFVSAKIRYHAVPINKNTSIIKIAGNLPYADFIRLLKDNGM